MFDTKIKRGWNVRDPITGLTGVVTNICERITGNIQAAIQPQGDGTSIPESYYIDDHVLEMIDEGFADKLPAIDSSVSIELGQRVRCTISGISGIAVEAIAMQNGCVFFTINTGLDSKGDSRKPEIVDHLRLVRVDEGVSPKSAEPARKSGTGGPNQIVPARRVPRYSGS